MKKKMDQVLIRTSPLDFSFINENNLEEIFGIFSKYGLKINLMQNSAINFSIAGQQGLAVAGLVFSKLLMWQ